MEAGGRLRGCLKKVYIIGKGMLRRLDVGISNKVFSGRFVILKLNIYILCREGGWNTTWMT